MIVTIKNYRLTLKQSSHLLSLHLDMPSRSLVGTLRPTPIWYHLAHTSFTSPHMSITIIFSPLKKINITMNDYHCIVKYTLTKWSRETVTVIFI